MITYLYSLRKTRVISACALFLLLISQQVSAQQVTITGQVADSKNVPIPLATINFVGNSITSTTDDNGLFAIKLPVDFKKGDQLTMRISKEGYRIGTKLITISPISIPIRLSKLQHYMPPTSTGANTNVKSDRQAISSPLLGVASSNTNSFGNVNPSIVGNGSHIVGGFGNSVGVNGDVNVTTERKVNDNLLSSLYMFIDNLVITKGFNKNNITVLNQQYTNAPGVSSQIILYFKERGYNVGSGFMSSGGPMMYGIAVDTTNRFIQKDQGKGIKIILGYFK